MLWATLSTHRGTQIWTCVFGDALSHVWEGNSVMERSCHDSPVTGDSTAAFPMFDSLFITAREFCFFKQRHNKPHYWPLACSSTPNDWCEGCSTFSQLVVQTEPEGVFLPFPHEWTRRFIFASWLRGCIWPGFMIPIVINVALSHSVLFSPVFSL